MHIHTICFGLELHFCLRVCVFYQSVCMFFKNISALAAACAMVSVGAPAIFFNESVVTHAVTG